MLSFASECAEHSKGRYGVLPQPRSAGYESEIGICRTEAGE